MEARRVPGLYFIGEVMDAGWLGYNFQWAWSSAWAAQKFGGKTLKPQVQTISE